MSNDRQKILELESLRGLAALLVVFFHLPKWNPILDINLINNGYLMVELFFVISGFVIFKAYSERITSWRDLLKFQFLRFGRLYPVHVIFLFLFLILETGKYFAILKYGTKNIRATPFGENNFSAMIEQLFLLQAILPFGHATTYNPPAWSISVEFYTYLIFGFITILFRKHKIKAFSLLTFIPMLLLIFGSTFYNEALLRCLAGFFLGCLTAYLVGIINFAIPEFTSFLLILLLVLFLQIKKPHEFDFLIFFITTALIITLVINSSGGLKKALNIKLFVWLGEISYSVYMSHSLIIWAVSNYFKRLIKRPEVQNADGIWVTPLSIPETLIAAIFVITAVLLISQLSFIYIEKPFREWARNFVLFKPSEVTKAKVK